MKFCVQKGAWGRCPQQADGRKCECVLTLALLAGFVCGYDKTSNHWMYGEKPIYILYDKEHYTFCDKGVSDGVSLNVVRDKDGNIEKLVSVDKKELEQFVS